MQQLRLRQQRKKTERSGTVQQPTPPPTVVKVDVDVAKKNVSILVQATSPEEALKISEEMMRQVRAMQAVPTSVTKTPVKAARKSPNKAARKKAR